ncbi:RNA polymerase sigma factor [Candidatus Poribacteria bacterium]|nr:RNA polymerase sigma factor [Candidatus Poribacteria bacterium]
MDNVGINRRFLEADDNEKEKAFELLFNTYHKIVFKKINRMMRSHPDPAVDAEDIAQETFIKAFKKRHQVREPEKLLGWLLTIAKTLTLNEIRDAKRRRQTGNSFLESLDNPSIGESEAPFATFLAETDAEQAEVERDMKAKLLCLLQGTDREVVTFINDGFTTQEIAEAIDATPDAVQKRLERIREWLIPIARNLETLISCLPGEDDRIVMERHLDGQPLSDIAKAICISRSDVEARVKRVIADWKKAARQNSTDPVSATVKND